MAAVLKTLGAIVGEHQITEWQQLSDDWQGQVNRALDPEITMGTAKGSPAGVVFPDTEEALAEVMSACHQNRWRVLICGQGTKLSWGKLGRGAEVVVSTAKLNRVIAHWVEDFTVRVEAGVSWADLQGQLRQTGQFLAIDPLWADQATLGGVVATGDTGSLRQRYGGVRDMLIGAQFIRHDGQIVKAGGRVVKNVAGYDLMKLMVGAYGTLGILSQLTFRLFPMPVRSQTIILSGEPEAIDKAALQVRQAGITPVAMDILMGDFGNAVALPDHSPGRTLMSLVGRFQGVEAGVEEQGDRFRAIGQDCGLTVDTLDTDAPFWQGISQALSGATDAEILCKVGLLPTEIVGFLQQAAERLPPGWRGRLHNGSGLGHIRFAMDEAGRDRIAALRSHCEAERGFLTILQASPTLKQAIDPGGYTGNALTLMQTLKHNFDPLNLLNPGRLIGS
jgi:glycolate oxidase FAD binding subunit